jgi:hypothetical protein
MNDKMKRKKVASQKREREGKIRISSFEQKKIERKSGEKDRQTIGFAAGGVSYGIFFSSSLSRAVLSFRDLFLFFLSLYACPIFLLYMCFV